MIGMGRRGCPASAFEAALAGTLGQGLHAAVVLVAAAIQHGGVDAGGPGGASREARERSCALTELPGHVLALIADALALVRLRRALLANDRGDLADDLLRVPLDDHARRLGHLELDALRRLDRHGVRVTERQLQIAALQG